MSGQASDTKTVISGTVAAPDWWPEFFGCIFGLPGIFTIGIVFVPLAAICTAVGLLRGIFGRSSSGIGLSVLAAILTFLAFVFSPTLWPLLFVAGSLH